MPPRNGDGGGGSGGVGWSRDGGGGGMGVVEMKSTKNEVREGKRRCIDKQIISEQKTPQITIQQREMHQSPIQSPSLTLQSPSLT